MNGYRLWMRAGKYIRPSRLFGWFLGVVLPIAIALSLFILWHNAVVGTPRPEHLLLRLAVGLVAFGIGGMIVYWKVFRPALRSAGKEEDVPARPPDGSDAATPGKGDGDRAE